MKERSLATIAMLALASACKPAPAPVSASEVTTAAPRCQDEEWTRLEATVTEAQCHDAPPQNELPARASGEPSGIRIDLPRYQRSCRAELVAEAFINTAKTCAAPRTVRFSLREQEDPPYSGCLCFFDVELRARGLAPGRYRVEGLGLRDAFADVP